MSDLKRTLLVGAVAVLTLAATPLAAQEQEAQHPGDLGR